MENRFALVTGSHKGMGLEWVKQLAKQGYSTVLTARDLKTAEMAAAPLINEGLNIWPAALDVAKEEQMVALAREVEQKWGQLDLLINNAGINPKDYADKQRMAKAFYLDQLDAGEMLEVIRINSLAPLLMVKSFRNLLKKSQGPVVINISSWLGSVNGVSFGGHYGYVGSKNLLNVLNKSMSFEVAADNIVSVNVNPGWVQTDMGGKKAHFTTEEAITQMIENIVNKANPSMNGLFLNFDGTPHPW